MWVLLIVIVSYNSSNITTTTNKIENIPSAEACANASTEFMKVNERWLSEYRISAKTTCIRIGE